MTRPKRPLPKMTPKMRAYIDIYDFAEFMRLEDEYVKHLIEDRDHWKLVALGPK